MRLAVLALLTLLGTHAQAAAQSGADVARGKLTKEIEHLTAKGYSPILAETVGEIAKDQPSSLRVDLTEGVEYAIVAACADCAKVELILLDAKGSEMARSPEDADTVILNGPAPATAEFEIAVGVPGCFANRCYAGVTILRKGAAEPEQPVQARGNPGPPEVTRLPPQKPAELIKSIQVELKRLGCYRGDLDGHLGSGSIAALKTFNRLTKRSLMTDAPEAETHSALVQHKAPVCKVTCDDDENEKDGVCVARAATTKAVPRPERSERQPVKKAVQAKPAGHCWTYDKCAAKCQDLHGYKGSGFAQTCIERVPCNTYPKSCS